MPKHEKVLATPGAIACLGLTSLVLTGCFGPSAAEKQELVVYQQNSKSFYDQGDMIRAEHQARRGLEIDSGDESLRLTLAYVLLRRGEKDSLEEAEEILRSLDSFFGSDDFRVLLGRGIARQNLSRLLEEDDPEAAARHRKAARRLLQDTVDLEPECTEAHFQLGLLDFAEDDMVAFSERAELTLELVERSIKAKDILLERATQSTARTAILRDREIDARRGRQLLRIRAEVAYREERLADAIADLDRLDDFLNLARVDYFNRARLLAATTDLKRAVEDYERFIQLSPRIDSDVEVAIEQLQKLRAKLAEQRVGSEVDGRGASGG